MPKIIFKSKVIEQNVIYTIESPTPDSSVIHYARWISKGRPEFKNKTELELNLGDLELQFNSGQTYRFKDVPKEVFIKLLDAESPGSFFNASIRGLYKYEPLKPYKLREKKVFDTKVSAYSEDDENELEALVDTVKRDRTIEKINSSGIAYTRYESDTFEIEFENGNCYVFQNVPEVTYKDFLKTSAKGSFYNKNIYEKYDFKVLDPVTLSSIAK